ncbi:DUF6624 domain-containing protein [Sediminicola sp. 1XM1-17]|uniref:DUF6624 domain-containing protein n=1 Tax=Sediminicola sp. 1XM1-17 TaxID=3127702 RepID=UPI0030788FC6
MSRILLPVLLFILVGCQERQLQKITEKDLIDRMVNQEIPELSEISILTEDGDIISVDSLRTLEKSKAYFGDFYVNKKNEIVQIVIREKTGEDEKLIHRLNQKLNEGPEVKTVNIDCNNKVNLLQRVFDRDQEMRRGKSQIDPKIDHENLEIIVSFLEKCGMPTLAEVDDVQMAAIWAVLQHAPAKYQSKYLPQLEKSATKGDIKWSVIALMKDRALMYEGKPQVYGSQINNGELYQLFEPEYVDQRRQEIGMESLKTYLLRFHIEFNVEQKRK